MDTYSKPKTGSDVKRTKMIFLGDPTQSRNDPGNLANANNFAINAAMPRTITVSEVFRTEIYDIARITMELQKRITGMNTDASKINLPATTYLADFTEGVLYAQTPNQVVDMWVSHLQNAKTEKILITRTAQDRLDIISRLGDRITEAQKDSIRFINESPNLTKEQNAAAGGTIQGGVVEGAYVAFEPDPQQSISYNDFKTAIGRASKFVVLPWASGQSVAVDNIVKTNSDPEAVKQERTDKSNRIAALSNGRKKPDVKQPDTKQPEANKPKEKPPTKKASSTKMAATKSPGGGKKEGSIEHVFSKSNPTSGWNVGNYINLVTGIKQMY